MMYECSTAEAATTSREAVVEQRLDLMLVFDGERGVFIDRFNIGLIHLIAWIIVGTGQQTKAVVIAAAKLLSNQGLCPFGVRNLVQGISVAEREAVERAIVESGLPLVSNAVFENAKGVLLLFHS